jgi:RimJ/RimL family protein N-acetyltransferase
MLTGDDVDAVFEAVHCSRAEISPWMPWCHQNYSKDDARQFIDRLPGAWQRGEEYAFGIFDAVSGELLGCAGLNFLDFPYRRANLGYWIRTDRTRQGTASTAARLLARAALEDLELERIEIVAAVDNRVSQRVAEKAGATREGVLRMRLRTRSGQTDAVCYSLIRADFELPALPASCADHGVGRPTGG